MAVLGASLARALAAGLVGVETGCGEDGWVEADGGFESATGGEGDRVAACEYGNGTGARLGWVCVGCEDGHAGKTSMSSGRERVEAGFSEYHREG